jgi:NitT/TauT family transport system substrate-binding protein
MSIARRLGILAVGVLIAGMQGAGAEPVKLRVTWAVAPAQLTPILFEPPGIAKHNGRSYLFESVRHAGSSVGMAALASGEAEIVAMVFTTLGPAIQNAGISDLRIIADEIRDGVEDYATNEYLVLKDGPVQKIEDLKGKVAATNAIGGGQDIFMRLMLRKHGLEHPRDYKIVEANFPNMKAFLAEKKADLVVGVIPFTADPTFRAVARTLFTQKEVVGPSDALFMTARASFLAKHREAVVDFLEDLLRARRWYTDPANKSAATEIISRFLRVPPERLGWMFTKADFYREPNGLPDLDSIQKSLGVLREFGFLKADIDVKQHADLSLIQEAAARLR